MNHKEYMDMVQNQKEHMDLIRRDQLRRLSQKNGVNDSNPGLNFVVKDNISANTSQSDIENQTKTQPQMPSILDMSKNLVKTAADVAKSVVISGEPLKLSDEEKNKRLSICESCEFYNKEQSRCTKCGCYMAVKTYLKAATCPVGKW